MLVLLTPGCGAERLLDYAATLGQRLEAGLDLLWLLPVLPPPALRDLAARSGGRLIQEPGLSPREAVKRYLRLHRAPIAAVRVHDPREESLPHLGGCPVVVLPPPGPS